KWIPQLSDAREVGKRIKRNPNVTYSALVPNEKGLEHALEAGIDMASVFMSASETHNKKNINKSIDENFPVLKKVIQTKNQKKKIVYTTFVQKEKGLEQSLEAGIDMASVFMSASETHNKKNINKSIDETFPVLKNVIQTAKQEKKHVTGYVSTVFDCPFEG